MGGPVFHSLSACAGCGCDADDFGSVNVEAFEATGELYCEDCAEEAIVRASSEDPFSMTPLSENPAMGGEEEHRPSVDSRAGEGPQPRHHQLSTSLEEFRAAIAACSPTTEDLNYLYTNVLHARGSLPKEVRREVVVAIKTYRDILEAARSLTGEEING